MGIKTLKLRKICTTKMRKISKKKYITKIIYTFSTYSQELNKNHPV